jgi:very-short-patch-repair endonuclease
MTIERRILGVSQSSTPRGDPKASFAATGARLDKLKERARLQRRAPTPAQDALWDKLGASKLGGIKFTRQAIVGSTVVDFACPSRWLVVVISPEGASAEVDALQDKKLTDVGVRVLRFAEAEVLDDVEAVTKAISVEVNKPFSKPGGRAAPRREGPSREGPRRDAGAARSSYGARPPRRGPSR